MTSHTTGSGQEPIHRTTAAESDTRISLQHDYALDPVPTDRRRGLYSLVAVWVGWAISVSSFLVGGAVGAGTTFGSGLTAILLGNAVLAVIGGAIGYIGYRTGLTTYLASRILFGVRGSAVPSIVLGVLAMGFIGVLMDAFGTAMQGLVTGVPWTVWIILFAVAVTATAVFGFKGLAVLSVFTAPLMLVFALYSLIRIGGDEGGFAAAVDAVPATPIGFDAAVTAVIATWITGAALAGDIGRYARRPLHIAVGAVCGYVLGAGFFETTAMISSSAVGNPNFVVVMTQLGLLLPAAVILALALWTTTDNNLYSSSLAFTNASTVLGRTVNKKVWVFVGIGIALATAFGGFAANFLSFLSIIGTVTPPFAGILIAHFYVLGGLRTPAATSLAAAPVVRWSALAAWAVTSVAMYFWQPPLKPLVGLVLGGALYLVVTLVADRDESRGRAVDATT
jgi:cytosine permease